MRRLLLASLLCTSACGGGEASAPPSAEVSRGRIERIVVATGTIEPVKEIEVRPRIAGIIEKIHVEDGDNVKLGEPLVEIERELLASQLREAEAAVRQAKVELDYAKLELDRAVELRNTGAASPQKEDAARSRHEGGDAALARAQANYDTLKTQLSYARITSPLAGRVLDVMVEEGSAVSPVTAVTGGTLLMSLAATDTLHLEGLVDENEVARVTLGQEARIRTEAYGERVFRGRVREIAPLGKRVQNVTYFEVEIEVTDPQASLLRPRMSGDGEIVTEVVEEAVIVPETALRYDGERVLLDVLNGDGKAAAREVQVGIVDGAKVQIVKGIEPGERVQVH